MYICSSPLIFQGDTGATHGQAQAEGVIGGAEGKVSLEAAVKQLTHFLRGGTNLEAADTLDYYELWVVLGNQ